MNKHVPHPASIAFINNVMSKAVSKEENNKCPHPLEVRYWSKTGSKCQGCGVIIMT
jgi:hypothetical protein